MKRQRAWEVNHQLYRVESKECWPMKVTVRIGSACRETSGNLLVEESRPMVGDTEAPVSSTQRKQQVAEHTPRRSSRPHHLTTPHWPALWRDVMGRWGFTVSPGYLMLVPPSACSSHLLEVTIQ